MTLLPTRPSAGVLRNALLAAFALFLVLPAQNADAQSRKKGKVVKNQPKKRKRGRIIKKGGTGRNGLFLRYGLGLGKCSGDERLCPNSEVGPSWADIEFGYRMNYVAVDLHFTHNFYDWKPDGALEATEGQLIEGGLGLKFFPLRKGQVDPFIGVRVGGMNVVPDADQENAKNYGGFSIGAVGGVDFFLAKGWAVGINGGYYNLFLTEDSSSTTSGSTVAGLGPEEGTAWTARISTIFYFGTGSGSSSSKKKKRRKKYTPTPKKKPAY